MQQEEEFYRWRESVNFKNGVKIATIQQNLLTMDNATHAAFLPAQEVQKRNIACFDIVTTIVETESNETYNVSWLDSAENTERVVFISGSRPEENFVQPAQKPFPVVTYFSDDGKSKSLYAGKLKQILEDADKETQIERTQDHWQFLDDFSRLKAPFNKFNTDCTHSEDFLINHLFMQNSVYKMIKVALVRAALNPEKFYNLTSISLVIHSRKDVCVLCTRKLAAVLINTNRAGELSKKLRKICASNIAIADDVCMMMLAASQLPFESRREMSGHDGFVRSVAHGTIDPAHPNTRQYYVQIPNCNVDEAHSWKCPAGDLLEEITFSLI